MNPCEEVIIATSAEKESSLRAKQDHEGYSRLNEDVSEGGEELHAINESESNLSDGQRYCIVCSSDKINDNERLLEDRMSLTEFCQLIKINIPPRSRTLLRMFLVPLCQNCEEIVNDVKAVLQQIEDLQRRFDETSRKLKEQIALSSKYDNKCCDINTLKKRSVAGVSNAVAFVQHHLRKNAAGSNKTKELPTSTRTLVRKKSGKKAVGSKHVDQQMILGERRKRVLEKDSALASSSHRSSFGRVVKRPRYLINDSELKIKDQRKSEDATNTIKSEELKFEKLDSRSFLTPIIISTEACSSSKLQVMTVSRGKSGTSLNSSKGNEIEKSLSPTGTKTNANVKHSPKSPKKEKILKEEKPVQTVRIIGANGEVIGTNILNEGYRSKVTSKGESEKKVNAVKIKCSKCEKTFADFRRKEEHMNNVHGGENYECQQCHTKFARLRDLFQHKKKQHPSPPKHLKLNEDGRKLFECEFCKIVFKNPADLQVHRRKHTGERPFKCEHCHEGFISKGKYEVHVEAQHPEIPPLPCDFCSRKFFRHHRLRDHRNSHTGERPYQCEVCGKSFSQPAYLKYHQTKHKELNLEEFKCDQCERKFASPVNLKFHKETQHQKKYRYHCSVCGHGASHVSHLKLHMRSHTGERPFSCPHCSKTFTRGSQLKIHIRSHTGERPYACLTCTKSFTNSSKLRRHELTHASNKSKRPKEIIKVTSLTEELTQMQKSELFGHQTAATTAVIIPEIHEENGQQFVKLEHVQSSVSGESDGQQLITIEQANGVTYQVIATNDIITSGEPFAEYIVLNGDFTLA